MKKTFIFFVLGLISFTFFSCPEGIPSPTIAYIEVLDSDDNPLYDCSFSAKYKDEDFTDAKVRFIEYSDEEFNEKCSKEGLDHIKGFKIGKTFYEIYDSKYSKLILKNGMENVFKDTSVTVKKDGYKEVTVCLTNSGVFRTTVVLGYL